MNLLYLADKLGAIVVLDDGVLIDGFNTINRQNVPDRRVVDLSYDRTDKDRCLARSPLRYPLIVLPSRLKNMILFYH